jgi:hypothetical protein
LADKTELWLLSQERSGAHFQALLFS